MAMFRRQHPKLDQNLWFVPETTSISHFAYGSFPPDFEHLPFKAIYGQLHCVKLVIHMFDLIFDISFVP